MLNFGPLAAEIVSLVWGTPGDFNGFRVLAALLHGILVVGVSQTAMFNRGRHLYSAGRPSRWALAHILVRFRLMNEECGNSSMPIKLRGQGDTISNQGTAQCIGKISYNSSRLQVSKKSHCLQSKDGKKVKCHRRQYDMVNRQFGKNMEVIR